MYINSIVISAVKTRNAILLFFGIVGLVIFGATGVSIALDQSEEIEMIITFFVLILVCTFMVYRAMKSRALIDSIFFYSRYFEGDLDGYINTSDMVKVIGKREEKINKELKKLLRWKCMTNFMLRKTESGMQVVLASKISKCECKNCGATIDKRIYFTGVCPYCKSSDLFAKLIK